MPDNTLEVRLAPERVPICHRAGQFAFVRFDSGPTHERHPFTISAAPSHDRSLRFSIKSSGDYTDSLHARALPEGSSASVEGPYGCFDFTGGRRRQLWVAGGIGITPFLAFLPTIDKGREVTLVWSVHTAGDAGYHDEIEYAIVNRPHVSAIVWPTAEKGHLHLPDLGIANPEELSVYLCGPVVMRRGLIEQLHGMGVRDRDIHFEDFTLR